MARYETSCRNCRVRNRMPWWCDDCWRMRAKGVLTPVAIWLAGRLARLAVEAVTR